MVRAEKLLSERLTLEIFIYCVAKVIIHVYRNAIYWSIGFIGRTMSFQSAALWVKKIGGSQQEVAIFL